MKKTVYSVLFLAFALITYLNLVAFDDGIVGRTRKNGNPEGCVCHGSSPSRNVSVIITGPSVVTVNDTATYTLRLAGGPAVAGGCDIATSLGTLYTSYLDTNLRRDEEFPGLGFEITHRYPNIFTSDTLEFIFKYMAPSTPGVIDTIFANSNSVNHDTTPANDNWNYAENFLIIIDEALPVELSEFNATVINNHVLLKWTTSSEVNNSGFDIERSKVNGGTSDQWINLGFVRGSGNSNTPNNYSFTDRNLNPGEYKYRLKQIDFNGNFKFYNLSGEVLIEIPSEFRLSQNFPNPFNPSTVISYSLNENDYVILKVYDISGKEVASLVNDRQSAGDYSVTFNGANFSSGVYFYKLSAGSYSDVKKMYLVK